MFEPAKNPNRLLVLDGTNLLYRSYHALSTTNLMYAGRPVWAVHGILLQIAKFVDFAKPSHILIAFDTPFGCPSRKLLDPGYKATRKSPEADLAVQLSWAPSILRQSGFQVIENELWEADDLLASAAHVATTKMFDTVIVTADRDAYQLLDEHVSIRTPDNRTVTTQSLLEDLQVSPSGYATLAALRGEPSDNLPGIAGVGAVTATRLVSAYRTLAGISAASDVELRAILGPKTIAALRRDMPLAERTFQVGCLRRDLPVDIASAAVAGFDAVKSARVLAEVGLATAARRIKESMSSISTPSAPSPF